MSMSFEELQVLAKDLSKLMKKHGGELHPSNAMIVLIGMMGQSYRTVAIAIRTKKNVDALVASMEEVGLA